MSGRGRLKFAGVLILFEVIVVAGGFLYLSGVHERVLSDGAHFSQVQALLLAEHASAALRQTEFALRIVALSERTDACAAMRRAAVTVPAIETAAVIGPTGELLCRLPGRPFPDLDLASIARLHGEGLADINLSVAGASGGMAMSVRIDGADGAYAGAVVAAISDDYFVSRYEEYGTIDVDLIVLYDQDGVVLARWPRDTSPGGVRAQIAEIDLLRSIPEYELTQSGLRTYVTSTMVGTLFKLPDYSYRVIVSYARSTLWSRWYAEGRALILTLGVLGLLGAVAAVWIRRSILAEFRVQRDLDESRRHGQQERIRRLHGLSALSGGLAHEINNQMMVVLGNAELLRGGAPGNSASTALSSIRTAATRASDLSERMLATTGTAALVRTRVDVAHLIRRFASQRAVQTPHGVSVRVAAPGESVWADVDPLLIENVLTDLTGNAVESLPSEGGTVRLDVTRVEWTGAPPGAVLSDQLEPGAYVRITVADNGSGIDADTLGRVLDPFFSTRFLGRGLGLPVAVGIARQHGGAVVIESALGAGTTVSLLLPASASSKQLL